MTVKVWNTEKNQVDYMDEDDLWANPECVQVGSLPDEILTEIEHENTVCG